MSNKPIDSHKSETDPCDNQSFQGKGSTSGNASAWKCGDKYTHVFNKDEDAWEKCFETIEKHDKELVEAWTKEIEFLLVFAGLFSAVVTAFVIDSYKGLQPDPTDTTIAILNQLSVQLSTMGSPNPAPPFSALQPQLFVPTPSSVRINVFHFLSLTCSLGTALVCILCMQWLREFTKDTTLPHNGAIAVRQMRLEGLKFWGVFKILYFLPVLLHISLVLFFIGLLDFLWSVDRTVAIFVTIAAGLAVGFTLITSILPSFQLLWTVDERLRVPQCPFKSPQSLMVHRILTVIICRTTSKPKPQEGIGRVQERSRYWELSTNLSWADYDIWWWRRRKESDETDSKSPDIVNALLWVNRKYSEGVKHVRMSYSYIRSLPSKLSIQILKFRYTEDCDSLEKILERIGPATEIQLRDIVSAFFLELHRSNYPELASAHLELVIRVINSHVVYPFSRWPTHDIFSPPAETISKFFMSIKHLVQSNNNLAVTHIDSFWKILHLVLSPHQHTEHVDLSFDIIHELEMWFSRSTAEITVLQVKACVHGMVRVYPLIMNTIPNASGVHHATEFLNALDAYLGKSSRASKILEPIAIKDWSKLVGREVVSPMSMGGRSSDLEKEALDSAVEEYPNIFISSP